jgi:hypothetical protein
VDIGNERKIEKGEKMKKKHRKGKEDEETG